MKLETVIGLVILVAFCVFVTYGGVFAQYAVYMYGCLAVGWSIPTVAKGIVKLAGKKEVAQ